MAKFLGKDPATYSKERDGFLRDLQHFHETRGTPFRRCPTLGGKEIDLYLLYSVVTAQGGWIKVNSKNAWPEILTCFKLPTQCVNGSVAIKQIYLRYLDRWEKVHFLGEEADRGSDDDEESRHRRWSARALHSVPYTYNYTQHNIADTNREYNHLSFDLYKPSDYDRLALSLISPLPNEQDFAINVCTLLSNDGKHTLKLEKHPRIVNYLLAHAGIYNHGSLRQLFTHFYKDIRKKPNHTFWRDVLDSKEFLDLADETKFSSKTTEEDKPPCDSLVKDDAIVIPDAPAEQPMDLDNERLTPSETDSDCCDVTSDCPESFRRYNFEVSDSDDCLFSLKRTLGTRDYVGQRVLQIATILRNLCFIEENLPILTNNKTFVRFFLLCASSRWNVLKNLGLDVLGNVSAEFVVKDLQSDKLAEILLKIVSKHLHSEDRAACISSLEVLNKLSQNERNEDTLLRSLESRVYKRVCSFLTIHDVMLLIYTLECLYSLSSLGERSCNFIANNHGVIDTLVSLVTVEGKSYGPRACIGMKLVETVPSGSSVAAQQANQQQASAQQQQSPSAQQQQDKTVASVSGVSGAVNSAVTTVVSNATPVVTVTSTPVKKEAIPSTPVRTVAVVPQRILATPSAASSATTPSTPHVSTSITSLGSMSPQQLIQQQHAHQQAIHENEQFALAWLRATYEPANGGRIDHQELYKHYMNSCSKIGRRGVISPLHFPRCVRSVFGGTVGPNPMKPANPSDPQYYDGIKVREQPLLINIPAVSNPKPTVNHPKSTSQAITSKTNPKSATQTIAAGNPKSTAAGSSAAKGGLHAVRRKPTKQQQAPLTVNADNIDIGGTTPNPSSPASPILKAQLSAPPKQRESGSVAATTPITSKADTKSQVMAHPHLSQALLGTSTTSTTTTQAGSSKDVHQTAAAGQSSSTSLIKSLLATKVNDCMSTMSMRTATDCQNVAQVAARQQRLLAQQNTAPETQSKAQAKPETKTSRLNGVRQLFSDREIGDPSVSSTTQFASTTKGKKEPPQPPPPPLAPLSNNVKKGNPDVNEDSDSVENNSLSSTSGLGTIGIGGVSSTEDGDNSLTSFEGLLNGIPSTVDAVMNDDSNSKDSVRVVSTEITIDKPLRLADLLEKKFEKSPPMLNGVLGKDIRALDLVENHIEKALNDATCEKLDNEKKCAEESMEKMSLKRPASDDIVETEAKRPLLTSNQNGTTADSPAPDSVSSSNGEDGPAATVSTAAAKLFADIAADILEDEDEEQLLQEAQIPTHHIQIEPQQQIMVDGNQMMMPRQIIVSQGQLQGGSQSIVISAGGAQLKQQPTQTVIVQNPANQSQGRPVLFQSSNQILLSQHLQGQVQLVASTQGGQYVLQTGQATQGGQYVLSSGQGGAYVVQAQPQTALVHGQQQTVLVAQTNQQQGTGAKTIIILQQQPQASGGGGAATHHQKVVVTPQGQQVVVTQVPRPVIHSSTVSNSTQGTKIIKPAPPQPQTTTNGLADNRRQQEEQKPKIKVIRDLSTAFTCEWGDCLLDTKFKSANEVYMHVCATHCPTGNEEVVCQWERCDTMKRKRFSLMTHLHDKHCNTEAMKQSLVRRKQIAQGIKVEPPAQTPSSSHPGYAPDAALHAIKRHALEFVNPKELQDDNEGPVTKSIRLTASLILRNLVIYSSNSKRYLKSYEPHLANVALSNVESSRTIAQILYDMNEGTTHR